MLLKKTIYKYIMLFYDFTQDITSNKKRLHIVLDHTLYFITW